MPSSVDNSTLIESEATHQSPARPLSEFNPCARAHFTSPFYDHDSPRISSDNIPEKSKTSLHVSVRDLESQSPGLTPTVTINEKDPREEAGGLRAWPKHKFSFRGTTPCQKRCLTKPQPKFERWSSLSKKQRLLIKLVVALLIVGACVGIGVGISLRVGGGVYKNQNQSSPIG